MFLEELELKSNTNYKVYTPESIGRTMLASIYKEYFVGDKRKKLDKIRACDIACGTGNLLLILIESLIRLSKIYYGEYIYKEEWVEGYDIDEKALEVFKERFNKLLLRYGIKGKLRVYHKNSLFCPIENKYNILLGNPPYLGEKNNKDIFEKIKETDFGKKYYEGRMDYLYFFIEKGLDALKKNGVMSYITTNYWLRADYAKILRNKIKRESSFVYVKNYNKSVFKDALGQHNIVFTLKKSKKNELIYDDTSSISVLKNKDIFDENEKILLAKKEEIEYFKRVRRKKTHYLGDLLNINQGIVSGCDKAFVLKEYKEEFRGYIKPFYKNSDVFRYYHEDENKRWILYLDGKEEPKKEIIDHLNNYRDRLEKRREVKKGIKNWWELQWARDKSIFVKEKIVGRQRSIDNKFALVNHEFFASADVYYLSSKEENISLKYILAFLNSKVFYKWFRYNGKNKGEYLELYATPLKETPIYYPKTSKKIRYIEGLIDSINEENRGRVEEEINNFFEGIYK